MEQRCFAYQMTSHHVWLGNCTNGSLNQTVKSHYGLSIVLHSFT